MNKALLMVVLLCCGSWVMAQSASGSSSQNGSGSANMGQSSSSGSMQSGAGMSSGESAANTKITGCLSQQNGDYALKDDQTGTNYALFGKQDLGKYVGQKIEVRGMQTSTSGQVASPNAQGVGQHASQNPFQVKSIKKAGGSCSGS